jgi:hypothetical protein
MTKIDLYTKIILTVIAICLFCMVFRDVSLVTPIRAQNVSAPTKVDIVAVDGRSIDIEPRNPLATLRAVPVFTGN